MRPIWKLSLFFALTFASFFHRAQSVTSPDQVLDMVKKNSKPIFDYAQGKADQWASVFEKLGLVVVAFKEQYGEEFLLLKEAVFSKNQDKVETALKQFLGAMSTAERNELWSASEELMALDGAGSLMIVFSGGVTIKGITYSKDMGIAINLDYLLFPFDRSMITQTDRPMATVFTADGLSTGFQSRQPFGPDFDADFLVGYHTSDPSGVDGWGIDVSVSAGNIDAAFAFNAATFSIFDPIPELVAVFFTVVQPDGPELEFEATIGLSSAKLIMKLCGLQNLVDNGFDLIKNPFPLLYGTKSGLTNARCENQDETFWQTWGSLMIPVGAYRSSCAGAASCNSGLTCNTQVWPPRCDKKTPKQRYALCQDNGDCDQYCNMNAKATQDFPGLGICDRKPDGGWLSQCTDHDDCPYGLACSKGACRYMKDEAYCQGNYYCASYNCVNKKCQGCSFIAAHKWTRLAGTSGSDGLFFYVMNEDKLAFFEHESVANRCGGWLASYPGTDPYHKDALESYLGDDYEGQWIWYKGHTSNHDEYIWDWRKFRAIKVHEVGGNYFSTETTGQGLKDNDVPASYGLLMLPPDFRNKNKYPNCDTKTFKMPLRCDDKDYPFLGPLNG